MTLNEWSLIAGIVASVVVILGGIGGLVAWISRKLDKRFDAVEEKLETLDARQDSLRSELDRQLGGNSNGIRQELNAQGTRMARIEGHLGIGVNDAAR